MAPSSSTSSNESDVERRHSTSKHKRKEKSHKKTKKRYKHRSDDDERGYKKFKRRKEKKEKREKNSSDDEMQPGPSVVQNNGPEVKVNRPETHHQETNDTEDTYGPALPPHLIKNRVTPSDRSHNTQNTEKPVIGPVIPAHLMSQPNHDSEPKNNSNSDDNDDVTETVGPLPGVVNPELETRALEIKLGHVSSSGSQAKGDEKARDEWMLELPEVRGVTDLGLTARQFRTKERPDFSDRSQWTDTPADKERKKHGKLSVKDAAKEEERERQRQAIASRDKEQERIAKEHKKKHKRDKSLMELHEKKLKKAKKEKEQSGPESRRPFDRNVDLAANRFDEAQKKSIIKKAQLLDTRFSSGASKFL